MAVEVGVPAVFAAVVGDEDEVSGVGPGDGGQVFAVSVAAEKGGAAVVDEAAYCSNAFRSCPDSQYSFCFFNSRASCSSSGKPTEFSNRTSSL